MTYPALSAEIMSQRNARAGYVDVGTAVLAILALKNEDA